MALPHAVTLAARDQCTLGDFLYSQQCVDARYHPLPFPGVALGGACVNDLECGADAYCGILTCPGVCVTKKALGAFAARATECASDYRAQQHCATPPGTGIFCDSSSLTNTCAPGRECIGDTCVRLEVFEQGEACSAGSRCRSGACRFGTCRPLAQEGQACGDCLEGLGCFGGVCEVTGLCNLCSERCADNRCLPYLPIGGVCSFSIECGPSAFCNSRNECAARASVGASCSGAAPCDQGLECEYGTNVCVRPVQNRPGGAGCDTDSDCAGYCFSSMPAYCVDFAPVGGRCNLSEYLVCGSGAYCDEANHCRAKLGGGMSCTSGEMCQSGTCSSGTCTFPRGSCIIP